MEHIELDTLGILRQTKLPQELSWLTDADKQFILQLYMHGEDGLHKREVNKFRKKNTAGFINMDMHGYLVWETDKAGRPMFLVLTWRGEDTAKLLMQIARNESHKKPTV